MPCSRSSEEHRSWVLHKHEPFTVADVQRAKEELEARNQAVSGARGVREEDHTQRWWTAAQIPDIVVHPCDNTPLKYAEVVYTQATIYAKPVDSNAVSAVDQVVSLEVSMPLSTALEEAETKEADAVTPSSPSGAVFVPEVPSEELFPRLMVSTTSDSRAASTSDIGDDSKLSSATVPDSSTPLTSSESVAFPVATPTMPSALGIDVDPSYSPASTASEPDSPMPLTPAEESHAFPHVFIPSSLDAFDSSPPPSTVVADVKGNGKDVGSSVSEDERNGTSVSPGPDSPLRVGLGLSFEEVQRHEEEKPHFVIGELSPANSGDSIFNDSWDECLKASSCTSSSSSSRSAKSVPDIRRVLNEATSQSSALSSKACPSESSTGTPSSPSPTRTPFAGILEVLNRHFPSSQCDTFTIGSSSSDIFHHYFDEVDGDNVNKKDSSANVSVAS